MPGGVKPPWWPQFKRAWAKSADPFGPKSAERQPRKLLGHTLVARVEEVPQKLCELKNKRQVPTTRGMCRFGKRVFFLNF